LRHAVLELPPFAGLPEIAPARHQNDQDKKLHTVHQKIGQVMQGLLAVVDCSETLEPEAWRFVELQAAVLRSVWQDVLELRRANAAGNSSSQLEKRPDHQQVQLLSADELKRCRSQSGRSRSRSRGGKGWKPSWLGGKGGRGKGGAKGKGGKTWSKQPWTGKQRAKSNDRAQEE
jgi:hypothetical protein